MTQNIDSSFISAFRRRAPSGGLVIVRAIGVIVPLVTALTRSMIIVSMMVLDPIASVPTVDDVLSIPCAMTLTTFIRRMWEADGWVPARALAMFGVLTSPPDLWI
jgi:hypothetical protein